MKKQNEPCVRQRFSASACGGHTTCACDTHDTLTSPTKKTLLAVLIGSAMAFGPFTAHAFEAKVSGQINRALMLVDDGTDSETHHVDNDISGTRFRFTGSEEIMPGFKGGILFEVEYQSNPSNSVRQTARSVDPGFAERHLSVFFDGAFGKVILGQGDGAADGGIEVDLSGTSVVQNSLGVQALGGDINFRGPGAAGPRLDESIDNQDFEGRYDRLRYETPAFGPAKIAVSTGVKAVAAAASRDVTEVALWYSGNVAGGKLAGALGLSKLDADPNVPATFDQDTVGGSISWLAASGLSLTFATSTRDVAANREGEFTYFKVGYKTGKHAVALDYATGEDQAATGDEADMVGVGYVYTPVKWAEIYAGFKTLSLDRPGSNFDDIQIITAGSRIKF